MNRKKRKVETVQVNLKIEVNQLQKEPELMEMATQNWIEEYHEELDLSTRDGRDERLKLFFANKKHVLLNKYDIKRAIPKAKKNIKYKRVREDNIHLEKLRNKLYDDMDAEAEEEIASFRNYGQHEMFFGMFRYWDQTRDDNGNNHKCPACTYNYNDGDEVLRLPNCIHWMHIECIERSLLNDEYKCAYCRAIIPHRA